MLQFVLEFSRLMVCFALLGFASWQDLKKREVSNRVWKVFAPVGVSLSLLQLLVFDLGTWDLYLFSIGVSFLLSVALFYLGVFGGADSKALMCLSLTFPYAPYTLYTAAATLNLFPVTILINSFVCAVAGVFSVFLYSITYKLLYHKPQEKTLLDSWKKNGVPMILFVLLGLIYTLLFGDFLLNAIR